jgi:hypothetical protein
VVEKAKSLLAGGRLNAEGRDTRFNGSLCLLSFDLSAFHSTFDP